MPPTSSQRNGVRVVAPPSHEVREVSPGRTRSLPGEPGYARAVAAEGLAESLRESGLETVHEVELTPRRTRGPVSPGGVATIEVDVAAQEDAVVLLERDGVYSWRLPEPAGDRTRSLPGTPGPGARNVRFEIELGPAVGGAGGAGAGRRSRGVLGDLVSGAVHAVVLRYAAPLLVDTAIGLMESHVRPGLVHITGTPLDEWRPVEDLGEVPLPTDRPARILLLVHGTFASTVGGFGALGVDEHGSGFLHAAIGAYDAVLGFDHPTLSADPRQNAEDLVRRLSAHRSEHPVVIDVITHSRGGLTTRSLVEHALPASHWDGSVDVVVYVAATNSGTHLADPGTWRDLIDVLTNLAVAGGVALAALPGGVAAGAVVAGAVKGIGAFVKYLVSYAGEGDGVPGLAAMMPDGAFVRDLNERWDARRDRDVNWYVVTSNFHVELFDDSHRPPEFPRELAVRLAEGLVDRIFPGDNDLVVDTDSMSAIGLVQGAAWARGGLELGTNDLVYHTNYFSQLSVLEAMAGWLPLGLGAGGEPEEAGVEPDAELDGSDEPDEAGPDEEPTDRGLPMAPPPPREPLPLPLPPQPRPAVPPPAVPPPATTNGHPQPEPVTVPAQLAAEMPNRPVVDVPFTVRVRLSRREIEASDDTVSRTVTVAVEEARPVSVHVVGKQNALVEDPAEDVFALPPGGGVSELGFSVRAERPGPVRVHVIVRQGTVPVATLELAARAGADPPARRTSTRGAVELGLDAPELEGLPCIEVIETVHGDAAVYEYGVRLERGGAIHRFTSPPLRDRASFVQALLARVEDLWVELGDRPATFLAELQDLGASLFEQLFPQSMQELLWRHRNDVDDLLLYADEPYMPWELVHLKPPVGPRQAKPRFLAQRGLVRWQFTGFPPKTLRIRDGRVRSLIPEYLDPAYVLAESALESEFLVERFGATPVPARPKDVRALLRSGDFDLLHFAGHGLADPGDIFGAKVLLQGRKRGRQILQQYLTATTVAENAKWVLPRPSAASEGDGEPDQGRPVVVLNACQVGRGGEQLSTLGGFAKAFLQSGAGAFVSSLWSVGDRPARAFVEAFYDELLDGAPVAVATVRARERARKAGDATWLAYAVYARPDATLTRT